MHASVFDLDEIDKTLKEHVIEPAKTEWEAPILFAPKMDGALRSSVDYRKLNTITVTESYSPHSMEECIASLGDAQVILRLDAN